MSNPTRLNFKTNLSTRDTLQRLKSRMDADTYSEVLRRSLNLYDFCLNQVESGKEVHVEKDGHSQEIPVI